MGNVHGAYGAKGLANFPMDGPAPAIVNAIEDALALASIPCHSCRKISLRQSAPAENDEPFSETAAKTAAKRTAANASFLLRKCKPETVRVYPMERTVDVLRQELGLTGAKKVAERVNAVLAPS